jgi:hypothetical protein
MSAVSLAPWHQVTRSDQFVYSVMHFGGRATGHAQAHLNISLESMVGKICRRHQGIVSVCDQEFGVHRCHFVA